MIWLTIPPSLLPLIGTRQNFWYLLVQKDRELLHTLSDKKTADSAMTLVWHVLYFDRRAKFKFMNPAENVTRWTQHGTDSSLRDRVTDIESWRQSLSKTLRDIEEEIASVSNSFTFIVEHTKSSNMQCMICMYIHVHVHVYTMYNVHLQYIYMFMCIRTCRCTCTLYRIPLVSRINVLSNMSVTSVFCTYLYMYMYMCM